MDKEKLLLLGKKLMKRADRVAIVLFLVLLLATGYVWLNEAQSQVQPPDPPQAVPWNQAIPSPEYENVREQLISVGSSIAEDPDLQIIVQNNMFDLKSVRSQAEQERQMREDFAEAERLFREANYDAALERLNGVLQRNPNHTRSLELKQRIEEALAPADEAADVPGPGESPAGAESGSAAETPGG